MGLGLTLDQLSLYRKDMYKAEREGMQEVPVMYPKIFKVITKGVTGSGDKYTELLNAGPLTRHAAEGQDIIFHSPVEGWTTYARYHTFSDGLSFSPEAIEDTVKMGNQLKELAGTWGRSVRVAKETLAAGVFNNGGDLLGSWEFNGSHPGNTDPSGNLLYDSKPFFNLSGNLRTTKGGGTYYNSIAGLTLTAANFETVYNLITSTNNRDEQDRVSVNDVDTILTGVGGNYFAAIRILKSENMAGGQLNDMNPYQGLVRNIYNWSYLDEAAFYVGKAQHPSMEFHERMAPEIRFFRNENNAGYKASIRVRFGVHLKPGAWRAWARGGGTSA